MNIILQGYMGSGKSTVAQNIASQLNLNYIDLDSKIENHTKRSVSQIFEEKGEIFFRKVENQLLQDVLNNNQDYVLALGGGTPCYGNNIELLKQSAANLIYLKASIGLLAQRLAADNKRPLLANKNASDLSEFIAKHLFERNAFYSKADYTINTDGKSPDEITHEIIGLLT